MSRFYDFLVVGGGIVGVTLAREIKSRWPGSSLLLIEKEPSLGLHSSGRNSGVLHSGIYYPQGTLKGRLCADGAKRLANYCEEKGLPLARWGKVILPTNVETDPQLDLLSERARANQARTELVDTHQLAELEPEAYSPSGRALFAPDTAVIDSKAVLETLREDLKNVGGDIETGVELRAVDAKNGVLNISGEKVQYGFLVNAAGLHADRVAHWFGAGKDYTILPFKGRYWGVDQDQGPQLKRLVYPVPDLRVPFLGIHFTRNLDGGLKVGPSALPAFGRENYVGVRGLEPLESIGILSRLGRQYFANQQAFRHLVHRELGHTRRSSFAAAAASMVPSLRPEHFRTEGKVGIRAQLLNRKSGRLEMDFVVERGERSLHVLNAVSPALTSSFAFAEYVIDNYLDH